MQWSVPGNGRKLCNGLYLGNGRKLWNGQYLEGDHSGRIPDIILIITKERFLRIFLFNNTVTQYSEPWGPPPPYREAVEYGVFFLSWKYWKLTLILWKITCFYYFCGSMLHIFEIVCVMRIFWCSRQQGPLIVEIQKSADQI